MTITAKFIDPDHQYVERSDKVGSVIPFEGNSDYFELVEMGIVIAPYVAPTPTVAELKAHLADYRWKIETGGLTVQVNGHTFPVQTDDRSQTKFNAILLGTIIDPTFSTPFKNKEGNFITLNRDECQQMATAVGDFVKKAFASEEVVQGQVDGGSVTTYDQVETNFDLAMGS